MTETIPPKVQPPGGELPGARSLVWLSITLVSFGASLAALRLSRDGGSHWRVLPPPIAHCPTPPASGVTPGLKERLRLPWPPLLSEEEVQLGTAFYGSGRRLRRVASKLLERQPITVVTLGGSVTSGSGVPTPQQNYASRFFQFINSSFPHSNHTFANNGVPATQSAFVAPCVERLVSADADIVVVEFSLNDNSTAPYDSFERRSFELLLRQLLSLRGHPAVLLLHHYSPWNSGGSGVKGALFWREPEVMLTMFSFYYDIPSISMRTATWHLMDAGVDGFKVDKVLRGVPSAKGKDIPAVAELNSRDLYFYNDTTHPGPNGHAVLAELLVGPLVRAVQEVAAGVQPAARQDKRLPLLPRPMIPNSAESASASCHILEDFKDVVKRSSGFEYQAEVPQAPKFVQQKWGWRGLALGAWAELEVDTRSPDRNATGLRTNLHLAHLIGYTGMGAAQVACISGCTCEPQTFSGLHKYRVTILKLLIFQVTQHKQCRLRVTIAAIAGDEEEAAAPQEQHKVLLGGVMVTHF